MLLHAHTYIRCLQALKFGVVEIHTCMSLHDYWKHAYVYGGILSSAHTCKAAITKLESYRTAYPASTLAESYHF